MARGDSPATVQRQERVKVGRGTRSSGAPAALGQGTDHSIARAGRAQARQRRELILITRYGARLIAPDCPPTATLDMPGCPPRHVCAAERRVLLTYILT